jgi:alkylation response protein AidB-like acyl-CoA dehydrogenase
MDFLPNDEQLALSRSAADLLAKRLPDKRVIAAGEWSCRPLVRECAGLGWLALGVAEDDGGIGASAVEETLVMREVGRALGPGLLLSSLLGARVAVAAGAADLAASIMAGETLVAFAEPLGDSNDRELCRVFDHVDADLLVTVEPQLARLLMPVPVVPLACLDELTSLGRADLRDAEVVATTESSADILHLGWVLASAMLSGIAETTRDMSVTYLHDRQQFGRPIGSFQALKHQAADMAVDAEAAHALTNYAALALAEGHDNAPLYCMSARVISHRAALDNARRTVQHHGAMGVTFEHDAHFYLKRTHVLGHVLGGIDGVLTALIDEPSPLGATSNS